MNLYTKFIADALFPLHERLKGHTTIDVFRSMEKSQWLSPGEMELLQLDRLRSFLSRIGRQVPYYRDLFNTLPFDPGIITGIDDLRKLPLMGKPEIRANTERLKGCGANNLQRFNTGGSSGEPLIFYLGKERVSHDVAAKRRATRWWGVDIGDIEIVVWGSPIELGAQDRIRKIRDSVFRTELLSAFEMSETKLDEFVDRIRSRNPKMLFGYPSAISLVASHAERRGIVLNDLDLRVVFVTSEKLYEHQREQIEKVFGCPVANGYGGRDAGFIAHQCPSGSLHITSEDIIVEIINDKGETAAPGEPGEIVTTHMATGGFPFVRYRTGDVGVIGAQDCACGRGLQVLEDVQGRTTDFVVARNGTRLHGLALIYVLRDQSGIEAFKIFQESLDLLIVYIVKGENYAAETEETIVRAFRARLGDEVQVKIEYCSAIPGDASGKFRYVVSRVDN